MTAEFISEPPAAPEAEMVMLGSLMLLKAGEAVTALTGLVVDDFSTEANRITFGAIAALLARGEAADPVSVLTELQHRGLVSSWPTANASVGCYLHGLVEVVPVPLGYAAARQGVVEASARRRIHRGALRLAQSAGSDSFESLTFLVGQETAAMQAVTG